MTRQTFFTRNGPFSTKDLAELAGASVAKECDLERLIYDVAPISSCGSQDVTLIVDRARLARAAELNAGACFIPPELADRLPPSTIALTTPLPEAAFARAIAAFYPDAASGRTRTGTVGTAFVDPSAKLEDGVELESGAVIGRDVEIGSGSFVGANAVICAGSKIGRDCAIGPGACVMHALIGDRVIIHPGARIGQDGFGYAKGERGLLKLPQIGRVIIQNDVEIGANATIDRGALEDTVIGEGTKIDNLVQIGHNVTIGRSCGIAGQSGLSGSVTVGDGVLIGGQSGTVPHITIGDGAQIGAGSGVWSDVPAGVSVAGRPHRPIDRFLREVRAVARLVGENEKKMKGEP